MNTANTRVFNVAIPGARMKLVGGDSGRYEHEEFVDAVMLAPSERVVVDVQFAEPGMVTLEHHTPDRVYPLAEITVTAEQVTPDLAEEFEHAADQRGHGRRTRPDHHAARPPPRTRRVAFVAEMDLPGPDLDPDAAVIYACPMHPEVTSPEPGRCPDCGMKLLPTAAPTAGYACPMHPEVTSSGTRPVPGVRHETTARAPDRVDDRSHRSPEPRSTDGDGPAAAAAHAHHGGTPGSPGEGIEWEDDMVEVNRMTTPANMRWILLDRDTGERNHGIDWRFRVGDQVKIRLVNEMESDHPMHHPFHVHGAGRFLILSRDGTTEPNLVWKDTVLVRRGETVDILLDVTNPGVWMAHCHIAEHHESGMMFNFHVDPADGSPVDGAATDAAGGVASESAR